NLVAVSQERGDVEHVVKPATLVALVLFAATGGNPSRWLLAALLFSLLGDVYLMLPGNYFVAGLVAFLAAHLAYTGAFHAPLLWRLIWLSIIGIMVMPLARRVVGSVKQETLRAGVTVYMVAIAFMAGSAVASGSLGAAA